MMACAVPVTWSRRTRSRSGIGSFSPARASAIRSAMFRSSASQAASIRPAASATCTWPNGSSPAFSPAYAARTRSRW